jgi:tRNA(Ile)-lysidine synthase
LAEHAANSDPDFDALFGAALSPFKRIVLAVSGGSDSMALMVLVARWIASGRAPRGLFVDVATVDHGLRAASSQEAEWVAARAKALGFSHTTLVWGGDKPGTGIQERAREARYALLVAHAGEVGASAVVTAHTADDQAETLIMRLGRGSGLDGLAGMARARPLLPDGSVQLVRPLLGLSKSYLAATLTAAGGTWLDDPSNERIDFERVRLRAADAHLAALGLSNDKLALSAGRLARARDALEHLTAERLAALADVHGGAYASLDRDAWRREPAEIRVRILARLLGSGSARSGPGARQGGGSDARRLHRFAGEYDATALSGARPQQASGASTRSGRGGAVGLAVSHQIRCGRRSGGRGATRTRCGPAARACSVCNP